MSAFKISPKAARVNAGINQRTAAKRLGIDVSTLRKYENNQNVPSWEIADKMCQEYGMAMDYIFFGKKSALSVDKQA